MSIEGSGGLTAHVGGSERIERREREEERQRASRRASQKDRDSFDDSLDEFGAFNPDSRPHPGPIPGISESHDHLRRWGPKKRGTQAVWIPERSDQSLSPIEQAFPDGESARVYEAARLEIVDRRPWLARESWAVQAVAIELDAGARRRDEFSRFLTVVDSEGDSLFFSALMRLAVLGVLQIERDASEVNTYSLKPEGG